MKYKIYNYLLSSFFLLVFAYILVKYYENWIILLNRWPFLILLALLVLMIIVAGGFRIIILLRQFNLEIPLREAIWISILTKLGNYFFPLRGGALIRAYYLKKKYKFAYTHFMATLSAVYSMNFFITSFMGLCLFIWLGFLNKSFNILPLLFFSAIIIAISLILFLPSHLSFISGRFSLYINKFLKGFSLIKNKKTLYILFLINFISVVIISLRIYILFLLMGADISFLSSLLVSTFLIISMLISITPAAWGIREAAVAYASNVVGQTFFQGFLISLFDRLVVVFILVLLAPFFVWINFVHKSSNENFHKI